MFTVKPIARIVEPQQRPKLMLREFDLQILNGPGRCTIIGKNQRQFDYEARRVYLRSRRK